AARVRAPGIGRPPFLFDRALLRAHRARAEPSPHRPGVAALEPLRPDARGTRGRLVPQASLRALIQVVHGRGGVVALQDRPDGRSRRRRWSGTCCIDARVLGRWKTIARDERGQDLAEYGIALGL